MSDLFFLLVLLVVFVYSVLLKIITLPIYLVLLVFSREKARRFERVIDKHTSMSWH